MQEAMLACIDIYRPEYILSEVLGLLNYTSNPTKPTAKFTVIPQQMSMRHLPMVWFCEIANSVIREGGNLLEYKHFIANPKTQAKWTNSYGNEIGHFAQGMPGCNTSTNTIIFIKKDQVPKARAKDVTYGLIKCLVRPEKIDGPNRTRLVAGGDRAHYPSNASAPTANLLTVKILINSIISTAGAKFMTMEIKDFYLNTPMVRYKYMQLCIADMLEDVIKHYNLRDKATPGSYIYYEIQKGILAFPKTTQPLQHRNSLVVLAYANKSATRIGVILLRAKTAMRERSLLGRGTVCAG
jgi:hypothetical protein